MNTQQKIAVMQAWRLGKALQVRRTSALSSWQANSLYPFMAWIDRQESGEPIWNFKHFEYRVKPVEPVLVTTYGVLLQSGRLRGMSETKAFAERVANRVGGRVVELTGTYIPDA